MFTKKIFLLSGLVLILAVNLFFGLPRLSRYSSVDEPYWTYDRTPRFWKAVKSLKWSSTDINDKPGITVAAISGLGLLEGNPLEYKSIRQEPKTEAISEKIKDLNFSLRLPIYFVSLVFLALFFWLSKKLLGTDTALATTIFIGLSPIILGISLIINPDSLLWGFLPLSILSYLVFEKDREKKYLILSGILLGLALLTKYVSNILFVYFFGLIFLRFVFETSEKEKTSEFVKKSLKEFLFLVLTSLLTFFAIYPAAWLDPKIVLEGTILSDAFRSTWPFFVGFLVLMAVDAWLLKSRLFSFALNHFRNRKKILGKIFPAVIFAVIIFTVLNTWLGMSFFNFESEMASPKGGEGFVFLDFLSVFFSDFYALIFALTPISFFFFIWAVGKGFFMKDKDRSFPVILHLLIFITLYYLASTANHVTATVRYQIVIFPLTLLISGIGFNYFLNRIKNNKLYHGGAWILIFLFSLACLFRANPHFFNYSSPLLPQKYVLNLKDMGDGSFEAAQFLNQLPNAKNLVIWSDKGAVCETFLGKCKVSFNKNDTEGWPFDYFVVSTGRKSRSLKLEPAADFKWDIDFEKAYSSDFSESDFEINFQGNKNNFVRVIKTDKIITEK